MKTEYPFIKHIPIAIVMSISHISGCAMICRKEDNGGFTFSFAHCSSFGGERETSRLKARGGSLRGDDRQWGQ